MSFRLGLSDGVSIVAARWAEAFGLLGYEIITVAGEGPVDRIVPGLEIGAESAPSLETVEAALADADLVVVENLCTIPMNLPASRVVGQVLAGRPAIMHHHDPPWQRSRFGHIDELPLRDPAWSHVTNNEMTRDQMESRGIETTTIYNPFPSDDGQGDRAGTRARLGVADDELLVAHPVRAIPRKNLPLALRLAEELGGTYWLLGDAEEDYDDQLDWLLSTARVRTRHGPRTSVHDIYAASDVVVFPSWWEGFGNPPIEASIYMRPAIVSDYPVIAELEGLGFRWFRPHQLEEVRRFLADPDKQLLEHNRTLAGELFSLESCADSLASLIADAGWDTPWEASQR